MEATLLDPILTLIAYADLTAGSALIFAAVVLSSFIITYWTAFLQLVSLISTGIRRLVVVSETTVWALIGWIMQLRSKEARLDARNILLRALMERLATCISKSCVYKLATAVYDWHVPANRPFVTLLRLFGTYCSSLVVWVNFLRPATSYLFGLFDVWTAGGRVVYCPRAISTYYLDDRLTRTEISNAWYCFGEKAGTTLDTLVADTWETLALGDYSIDDDEINHFYAFAVVSCVISLATMALALFTLVPRSSFFQRVKYILAELWSKTGTQTESHLRSILNQRQLDLVEKDAQLANKTVLLSAISAELQFSKKQQEDNWALVGTLRDRRNEAVEARQLEQAQSSQLRVQLDQISRRFRIVETTLHANKEELTRERQEANGQQKQLSSEREELSRWRQQLSSFQECVSSYEVLVAEKQQLSTLNRG